MLKDLIIIGAGQSALACAYYLRRTDIDYTILDASQQCGGSWNQYWDSLTLFSPAKHSSLPGWFMPPSKDRYPTREEVIDYLCKYEKKYNVPVERPVEVDSLHKENELFTLKTSKGNVQSRAVISATGTLRNPYIPNVPGKEKFNGKQIHSAHYQNPDDLAGKKVLIVGEGNSGAQILAEVSKVAETFWATKKSPDFLPDDVDGHVLFDVASAKYYAKQKGEQFNASQYNLGNIVMVPSVKEAREHGVYESPKQLKSISENGIFWTDGSFQEIDVIIWCTGFGYATQHLKPLVKPDQKGKVETEKTRAINHPGLWLVGYGGFTGFASATLIGVGRTAKQTIKEVEEYLKKNQI
jgi:thioredoxin reductase